MLVTMGEIRDIFQQYTGKLQAAAEIDGIMTDSRVSDTNALFVPIIGEHFDGHDFLQQAITNGAIAAIWDEEKPIPENVPRSFVFFFVKDTVEGLQELAKYYRNTVDPIVIGITGSNGKTTTKDLMYTVLKKKFQTHATKGNFNNEIGLPLTILAMKRETEVLIVEMGMNHFCEIEKLSNIAKPNYAVITNIGESHIEYLGSREGIAKAKLEIVSGMQNDGTVFLDGDEPLLSGISVNSVITCGFQSNNLVCISDVVLEKDKTVFRLNSGDVFQIPLLGKHHAKNASFVIALARKLSMEDTAIQAGLKELAYSNMRFEQLQGTNDVTLINDAYNASATSMKAAIDVIKKMSGFKKKILVLGDILELGSFSSEIHRSVAEVIDCDIHAVFTIGEHARAIIDELIERKLPITCRHFTEKRAVVKALQPYLSKETIILFKASRRMAFEEIVEACQ